MVFLVNPVKIFRDRIPYRAGMITDDIKSKMPIDLEGKRVCWALGGGLGDLYFLLPFLKYAKDRTENLTNVCAFAKIYMDVFIGHPVIDHLMSYGKHNDPDVSSGFDHVFDFGHAITRHEEAERMTGVQAYFKWIDNDFDISKLTPEDQRPIVTISPMVLDNVYKFIHEHNLQSGVNVALQLRSSALLRNWLPEYNRKLAHMLSALGCNVLLFDNLQVGRFSGNRIFWVNSTLKSMSEVIALLDFCSVMIGPDSSFLQIAQGMKKPFVGIYGAFPKSLRTIKDDPENINYSIELNKEDAMDCQPCFLHKQMCPHSIPSPCMEKLTPEMVFENVKKALNRSQEIDYSKISGTTKKSKNLTASQVCCPYCESSHLMDLKEYSIDVLKCNSKVINDHFKDSRYKICLGCRSIYYSGKISNKGMLSLYNEENYHSKHAEDPKYLEDMKIQANQTLDIIDKYLRDPLALEIIEVADFGCGIAAFDRYLIDLDPEAVRVSAFDVSTQAAHIAKKKFNIDVNCFDIVQDVFPRDNYYNVVIISHTLEHLNCFEIVKVLDKAHTILNKEAGVLYIRGPDASRFYDFQKHAKDDIWIHLKPSGDTHQHMSLSTIKGITTLLMQHDFKVLFASGTDVFEDDFHLVAKPEKKVRNIPEHVGEQTMTRLTGLSATS